MAIEERRGCGYRKVGGKYIVSNSIGGPCCRMPIPLCVCPTCNMGIKHTRSYAWIDPKPWLQEPCSSKSVCAVADPERLGEKVLLMWVGEKFYPTAKDFIDEANRLGVSKRVSAIPKGLEVGKSWIFLAHPKVIRTDEGKWLPGIFRIFQPDAIEQIITQSQAKDSKLMAHLHKSHIRPVIVPDDDPDHQPNVPKAKLLQSRTTELNIFH